jgi:hypothetical protein
MAGRAWTPEAMGGGLELSPARSLAAGSVSMPMAPSFFREDRRVIMR